MKVLLIDGQNNHDWQATTPVLKWILEDCGRFAVDVTSTPSAAPDAPRPPKGPLTEPQQRDHAAALEQWRVERDAFVQKHADAWRDWRPAFDRYEAVLSNYNGELWPADVRREFETYIRNGGGLAVVHGADNAFPEWSEFNAMISVGGWGGRNEKSGPCLRFRDGRMVLDTTPGRGGTHGRPSNYVVEFRERDHPISRGLPAGWRHVQDELYGRLRGPAQSVTVLATALSDRAAGGTGEIEPVLMTIAYGRGRVFHDVLGHDRLAMTDVGFQVTLQRGVEWAATGAVSLPPPPPADLPMDRIVTRRPPG